MGLAPRLIRALACAALALAMRPANAAEAGALAIGDGARRCAPAPGTQEMWMGLQDGDTCQVVAFDLVPGATPPIFFQLQAYLAVGQAAQAEEVGGDLIVGGPGADGAGVVLLVPTADRKAMTPLQGWSGEGAVTTTPRIVRTRQGPILIVPMSADVSSAPTYDAVFRAVAETWTPVTDDWSREIVVPKGLGQWRGNVMDWPTLRAFGAFWKGTDANCCPTGGSYVARLRLDGTHLRLASVQYSHHLLPSP